MMSATPVVSETTLDTFFVDLAIHVENLKRISQRIDTVTKCARLEMQKQEDGSGTIDVSEDTLILFFMRDPKLARGGGISSTDMAQPQGGLRR